MTVTSVGVSIPFTFSTSGRRHRLLGLRWLDHRGDDPGRVPEQHRLATPTVPPEKIQITWVSQIPVKQVLLAWAGQRVLVEHDWRIRPVKILQARAAGLLPVWRGATFAM